MAKARPLARAKVLAKILAKVLARVRVELEYNNLIDQFSKSQNNQVRFFLNDSGMRTSSAAN